MCVKRLDRIRLGAVMGLLELTGEELRLYNPRPHCKKQTDIENYRKTNEYNATSSQNKNSSKPTQKPKLLQQI